MARLICTANTSVDGYLTDENGDFDWGGPDPEVLAFLNDLERPIGTYLYGRRQYEAMVYWETFQPQGDEIKELLDYAELWRDADKIVYSSTLPSVTSARTSLERTFDPDAVLAMKDAAVRDLSISGPTLAAHALRAGLVDEVRLYVWPVAVGGGLPMFPAGLRLDLRLVDERRFANGVVHLRYLT